MYVFLKRPVLHFGIIKCLFPPMAFLFDTCYLYAMFPFREVFKEFYAKFLDQTAMAEEFPDVEI